MKEIEMSKNKDRGTIKWTAMMLPEHVAMLRDWHHEQRKVPKPALEEQQYEEFSYTIAEAMEYNNELTITYWKNGFYEEYTGQVHYADPVTKRLHMKKNEDIEYIPIDCIVAIK
ncbi:YolD-like family protein [Evansella clarkii]|uniref:YolD-like family protein n=1 Tax=Evansella clarkii TaxID=79879 RepID=UPI0010659FBE|nr:YolD-like family protein [Evansella clarkii]